MEITSEVRRDGELDYGWARLDSSGYRMHCNEKDTTGNILAVSNICSLYMCGSYNDCNSSAICGLSCSSWEATRSKDGNQQRESYFLNPGRLRNK